MEPIISMKKKNLERLLETEIVTIKVEKPKNSFQVIQCTNNPLTLFNDYKVYVSKTDQAENQDSNMVKAYDIESNKWQAFLASNVMEINYRPVKIYL